MYNRRFRSTFSLRISITELEAELEWLSFSQRKFAELRTGSTAKTCLTWIFRPQNHPTIQQKCLLTQFQRVSIEKQQIRHRKWLNVELSILFEFFTIWKDDCSTIIGVFYIKWHPSSIFCKHSPTLVWISLSRNNMLKVLSKIDT